MEMCAWKVSNSVPPPTRHTIDSSSTPMQVYKSMFASTSERFTNAHSQTQHVTQADLGALEVTSPPPGDLSGTAQSAADVCFVSGCLQRGIVRREISEQCNALYMHVRFSHNVRCRNLQATRTNICVYCSSSVKSVVGARLHTLRALTAAHLYKWRVETRGASKRMCFMPLTSLFYATVYGFQVWGGGCIAVQTRQC